MHASELVPCSPSYLQQTRVKAHGGLKQTRRERIRAALHCMEHLGQR